jgi:membrane protease YdiL (CAAX protease family)
LTQQPFKVLLWQIPVALLLAILLAETYAAADRVLPGPGWLAAVAINSFLSVVIWLQIMPRALRQFAVMDAVPGLVVILGVVFAASASSFLLPHATQLPIGREQLYWIIWVPFAEEIVFRGGCGRFFSRFAPRFVAAYVSALLFAFVHSAPTVEHVLTGQVGIPLGPFLLALVCETLLIYGRSIWCVIGLHAACNASIALFAAIDARWLDWLGYLYG